MRRITVPEANLELQTNSPVLEIKYDKPHGRVVLDIDQNEISHKHLRDTGGDPHPQYLDMIRHQAMDHNFLLESLDQRYLHEHPKPIKYFFERHEIDIEPGCMGYTVPPVGCLEISDIVVASRTHPELLKYDILFKGTSIFTEPVTNAEFLVSSYGKSVIFKAMIPNHDAAILGPGLLEIMILEAEEVSDLLVRIEFK